MPAPRLAPEPVGASIATSSRAAADGASGGATLASPTSRPGRDVGRGAARIVNSSTSWYNMHMHTYRLFLAAFCASAVLFSMLPLAACCCLLLAEPNTVLAPVRLHDQPHSHTGQGTQPRPAPPFTVRQAEGPINQTFAEKEAAIKAEREAKRDAAKAKMPAKESMQSAVYIPESKTAFCICLKCGTTSLYQYIFGAVMGEDWCVRDCGRNGYVPRACLCEARPASYALSRHPPTSPSM